MLRTSEPRASRPARASRPVASSSGYALGLPPQPPSFAASQPTRSHRSAPPCGYVRGTLRAAVLAQPPSRARLASDRHGAFPRSPSPAPGRSGAAPARESCMDEQTAGATALGILVGVVAAGGVTFLSRSGAAPIWIALCVVVVGFLAAAMILAAIETSRR